MFARTLLFAQLVVLLVLTGLHIGAVIYFWYWQFFWFDIIAHFLGGLWAGLFAAWLLALRDAAPRFLFCIAVTILLGVAWELFELSEGFTEFPADTLDTVHDLIMDVVGGASAVLASTFVYRHRMRG